MGHSSWTSLPVHFYVHDCPNRRRKPLCRMDILTFVYSKMTKRNVENKIKSESEQFVMSVLTLSRRKQKWRNGREKKKNMCCRKRRKKINIISHFCLLPTTWFGSSCILNVYRPSISIAKYSYHFFFPLYFRLPMPPLRTTILIIIFQLFVYFVFYSFKIYSLFNLRHSTMWNGEPGKMAFVCNQLSKLSFCVKIWTATRLHLVPPAIKLFVVCECAKYRFGRTASDFTARI